MSTLERFLIYAMLASPVMLFILVVCLAFSKGIAFILSVLIAAGGAWLARGWKNDLDRDYRIRSYRIEP